MALPLSLALALLTTPLATAAPITPSLAPRGDLPSTIAVSTALSYLSQLPEAEETNADSYDRDAFTHWIAISGNCDTRETVLSRDGTGVQTGGDCYPTAGEWFSDYDGVTETDPSELDVDHIVPLREAWVSGASAWTDAEREEFANDLDLPQLLAVSASSNRSKGAGDPANWLPERAAFQCEYVRAWVHVKNSYGLSVDAAEKEAISDVLNNMC